MFPLLQIGPFALQLPGLFLLIGLWVGSWLIDRLAPRYKLSATILNNMVFVALVAGILGARIWYAARYLDVYLAEPLSFLSLNLSTLAPTEGILTGLAAAVIYAQKKGLALWPTLDALTLSLAFFAITLGISHLASGDAYGTPSELPWAIELWGELRHPTQIYEIIITGLIFLVLWRIQARMFFPGLFFLSWVSLTAAGRLFLEAFRGDSVIIFGTLRLAQILSLFILLVAMLGINNLGRRSEVA